ncbi:hypothetical protein [Parasphingorhabdus sp.]|uniref:hypothetical protein n=1 Tax=Parasphingorhabdus sp. TaxID=2709688 RepID=UPI003001960F
MKMFDRLRSILSQQNETLANARKAWRDEKLDNKEVHIDERMKELLTQELMIDTKLKELRSLEQRTFWRKLRSIVLMAFFSISGLFLGLAVSPAESENTTQLSNVVADKGVAKEAKQREIIEGNELSIIDLPSEPPHARKSYPDPDKAAEEGKYGSGKNFDVGSYCLDVEKYSSMSFEQCLGTAVVAFAQ